jgi:hypothetical protein
MKKANNILLKSVTFGKLNVFSDLQQFSCQQIACGIVMKGGDAYDCLLNNC